MCKFFEVANKSEANLFLDDTLPLDKIKISQVIINVCILLLSKDNVKAAQDNILKAK